MDSFGFLHLVVSYSVGFAKQVVGMSSELGYLGLGPVEVTLICCALHANATLRKRFSYKGSLISLYPLHLPEQLMLSS